MTISEVIRLRQVEHVNSEKTILAVISHPFIVNMYVICCVCVFVCVVTLTVKYFIDVMATFE